jgi:hypothetical protein
MRDRADFEQDDEPSLPAYLEYSRREPDESESKDRQARTNYGRRSPAPTAYNGMHRRRKKRIMW